MVVLWIPWWVLLTKPTFRGRKCEPVQIPRGSLIDALHDDHGKDTSPNTDDEVQDVRYPHQKKRKPKRPHERIATE